MVMVTFTQEDLDTLKEALVSGATRVTIGDRTVEFRSKSELLELIDLVETQLAGGTAATENTTVIVGGFQRLPDDEG